MGVDIKPFMPAEASDEEFDGFYEITLSSIAVDRPDAAVPTREELVAEMLIPMTTPGPTSFWAATDGGRLLGWANVHLPAGENSHIANVKITVDPEARRQGVGTRLARRVATDLRRLERGVVMCRGVTEGGAGDEWARAFGFRVVQRTVLQRLVIAETDPSLWDVDAPAGYHAREWSGSAPASIVDSFARARDSILDAPSGDTSFRLTPSDAGRVRAMEADLAERGFEYFVVAVCDGGGEVVGLTEMLRHGSQPDEGMQQYTAILAAHRGHGLGRFAKATMMRWLVQECPAMLWIGTSTGAENTHMIAINHQLGYSTVRTAVTVEASLVDLERALENQGSHHVGRA